MRSVLAAATVLGGATAAAPTIPTWLLITLAVVGNTAVLRIVDWWVRKKRTDAEADRAEAQAESIAVTTATELVGGVRREMDTMRGQLEEARSRVASLETLLEERGRRHLEELRNLEQRHIQEITDRENLLQDMRLKIVNQDRELKALRALIAGRMPGRHDDPDLPPEVAAELPDA